MTSYPFLKIEAATAKYYFRFRFCWCHCFQNVNVYQQTKFRRHIWIGGSDITTSVFEKQMSAILEFYFLSRSRPVRRNMHVIMHQAAEFRPNRSTHCRNMTSYRILKMAAATAKYYFRFRIYWCHCSKSIGKPNFVEISQLAAEILLLPVSKYKRPPWRHIDFQDGGRQPCCICFGVMADHPRSPFRGLNSVLKSLVRQINSSRDIASYRFWRFGLKLPIHAFLGHISPYNVTHRPDPQQDRLWAESRRLSHSA